MKNILENTNWLEGNCIQCGYRTLYFFGEYGCESDCINCGEAPVYIEPATEK